MPRTTLALTSFISELFGVYKQAVFTVGTRIVWGSRYGQSYRRFVGLGRPQKIAGRPQKIARRVIVLQVQSGPGFLQTAEPPHCPRDDVASGGYILLKLITVKLTH